MADSRITPPTTARDRQGSFFRRISVHRSSKESAATSCLSPTPPPRRPSKDCPTTPPLSARVRSGSKESAATSCLSQTPPPRRPSKDCPITPPLSARVRSGPVHRVGTPRGSARAVGNSSGNSEAVHSRSNACSAQLSATVSPAAALVSPRLTGSSCGDRLTGGSCSDSQALASSIGPRCEIGQSTAPARKRVSLPPMRSLLAHVTAGGFSVVQAFQHLQEKQPYPLQEQQQVLSCVRSSGSNSDSSSSSSSTTSSNLGQAQSAASTKTSARNTSEEEASTTDEIFLRQIDEGKNSSGPGLAEQIPPKPWNNPDELSRRSSELVTGSAVLGPMAALLSRRRFALPLTKELSAVPTERTAEETDHDFGISRSPPMEKIKWLAGKTKIYDLYHWEDVLQEEGQGGKVVICRGKSANHYEVLKTSLQTTVTSYYSDAPLSPVRGFNRQISVSSTNYDEFKFVMKIKSKAELREDASEDQFRASQLRFLNLPVHEGVLPIHEVLEDDLFFYVVMEKATGGSLLNSLLDDYSDGNMPHLAIRDVLQEILEAVSHVHKQGILHRDIKPDNLVVQVSPKSRCSAKIPQGRLKKIKLIDFDLADPDWSPATPTKRAAYVGTLRHSAPETMNGEFSERSDLYSVGTILYLLIAGRMPYDDDIFDFRAFTRPNGPKKMIGKMREFEVSWDAEIWRHHPLCLRFCKSLIEFCPKDRPASAEAALQDPWFFA